MAVKIYVVTDPKAIELIQDNDIDGFKLYVFNEDLKIFDEPVEFNTESEGLAFCAGLGYGVDERDSVKNFPLRNFENYDLPFIQVIEQYLNC